MTDNDRFLRACRREPVDATPVWFMRQAGRALPEFRAIRERASLVDITRDPARCAEVTLLPVERLGVDAAILFADITTPLPGMGVEVELRPGVGPVIERAVRSPQDVERLRPFAPEDAVPALLQAIRLVRRSADVPLIGFAGAPFTLACYLVEGGPSRDFLTTKTLLHAAPGTWSTLMDRLTAMTVSYLRAQVAAGVQAVQLFDSWAGALAPLDYERAVAPWNRRLFAALADLGVPTINFAVGTAGFLELQAGTGGDVVGLDWRITLAEGWSRVGDRAVQGNLDPAALLGPFEAVADAARAILDQAAGRPGHIFNLGHGVLPQTDPDQLRRLVDLVHALSSGAAVAPPETAASPVEVRNSR